MKYDLIHYAVFVSIKLFVVWVSKDFYLSIKKSLEYLIKIKLAVGSQVAYLFILSIAV